MGGGSSVILQRGPQDKYLLREGRETPAEITASRTSPGSGMVTGTNKLGATYAWLVYDFAVGESTLKPGHQSYLSGIVKNLSEYGRLHNKTGTILINGYASPSGVHGHNVALAAQRANNVLNHFVIKGRLPRDWFYVRNEIQGADIYAVKGTPVTPQQRALCRGAYIVLWLMRDVATRDVFAGPIRERARSQIAGRFQKYEEWFYYWVIDNWNYLQNAANSYVREAFPQEHGLFFKLPSAPLEADQEIWNYLKSLHGSFNDAAQRLKNKYTGVPGHSALPAGGDPVRCYQQLARWIALDGYAREGSVRVFDFMPGQGIQKAMNDLIDMINGGTFGDKTLIWNKIEQYMRDKRIPMTVVRKPVR